MDFIKYPPTVTALIEELINACDGYIARIITEQELRALIHSWGYSSGDKLFNGAKNFNPTVTQRLGKKRLKLVEAMLEGYQQRIL